MWQLQQNTDDSFFSVTRTTVPTKSINSSCYFPRCERPYQRTDMEHELNLLFIAIRTTIPTHLSRRLDLWCKGSLDTLLNECRCIQEHLKAMLHRSRSQDTSQLFDHLMSEVIFQSLAHLVKVFRSSCSCRWSSAWCSNWLIQQDIICK